MTTRRAFTAGVLATPVAAAAAPRADARLAALEKRTGGRMGVFARDTRSGAVLLTHRASERFAMCSTFKASLSAFVLSRVDAGKETLERPIKYGEADLLAYAPVTRAHAAEGALSVAELCKAAIQLSDNTAANLLLRESGGPAALTAWWRKTGDKITRLDRIEPSLNEALPGDLRDTTTPLAMASTLERLLLGAVLTPASRARLLGWMQGTTTGLTKLRAGAPSGWSVADKTGSGERGTFNDIALITPPSSAPIVVAVYTTGTKAPQTEVDAVMAAIGRLVTGGRS